MFSVSFALQDVTEFKKYYEPSAPLQGNILQVRLFTMGRTADYLLIQNEFSCCSLCNRGAMNIKTSVKIFCSVRKFVLIIVFNSLTPGVNSHHIFSCCCYCWVTMIKLKCDHTYQLNFDYENSLTACSKLNFNSGDNHDRSVAHHTISWSCFLVITKETVNTSHFSGCDYFKIHLFSGVTCTDFISRPL